MKRLMLLVFFIGFIGGLFLGSYSPKKEYIYESIKVNPGDTLWDLTAKRSRGSYNIQELIYQTNAHNGISGIISPGQNLELCVGIK